MASAAVTCPIDVCKTRIVSRDKAQQQAYLAALRAGQINPVEHKPKPNLILTLTLTLSQSHLDPNPNPDPIPILS